MSWQGGGRRKHRALSTTACCTEPHHHNHRTPLPAFPPYSYAHHPPTPQDPVMDKIVSEKIVINKLPRNQVRGSSVHR